MLVERVCPTRKTAPMVHDPPAERARGRGVQLYRTTGRTSLAELRPELGPCEAVGVRAQFTTAPPMSLTPRRASPPPWTSYHGETIALRRFSALAAALRIPHSALMPALRIASATFPPRPSGTRQPCGGRARTWLPRSRGASRSGERNLLTRVRLATISAACRRSEGPIQCSPQSSDRFPIQGFWGSVALRPM